MKLSALNSSAGLLTRPQVTAIAAGTAVVLVLGGCVQMPIPTAAALQTFATPIVKATVAPSPFPATPAGGQTTAPSSAGKGNPANGAKLFAQLPCSSCHDVSHPFPGGEVCPNLGNVATEAARIVKSPDYHGKATNAVGYIRESTMDPNAYIVPGDAYHTSDGQSAMPKDFGKILTPQQIDDLVAYLLTLK